MDKHSRRYSEEGEISSNNDTKRSKQENQNSSLSSESKHRKSHKNHSSRSRSRSNHLIKKSQKNKKNYRSHSKSKSRSRSYKSSSTEKISKAKKDRKDKHIKKHKSSSRSRSKSRSDSYRQRKGKYTDKERVREKEKEREKYKSNESKSKPKNGGNEKKSKNYKSSEIEKGETGSITVSLNKLNTMNFSTKSGKASDLNLHAASSIKKPINLKGKYEDKKVFGRNKNKEEKDKKGKLIVIEEKEDKNSFTEENIDFEAFFDEELKQKEEEKQRESRRMRLEQIKKINENPENANKDNVEFLILPTNEFNKDESSKAKLPSSNTSDAGMLKNEELNLDEDNLKENEFKLNLKLAEELDFIKDSSEYDMNLKINEITPEERQRLLTMVEKEREKNYEEENYRNEIENKDKDENEIQNNNNKNLNKSGLMEIESDEEKVPDMFAETPVDDIDPNKKKSLNIFTYNEDNTGYYTPKLGEIINNQYKVTGICGKGIFSTVVKVVDIISNHEYAIKIVRNIEIMMISAEKEKNIIKKLNEIDKHDKTYIIRMVNTFEIKRHICMVFELCDMNLRDFLKSKSNQGGGIGLSLVKLYARQLLIAFSLVHKLKIIHADFKPDNTVVCKNNKIVKLCDFGSALREDEIVITCELVSRFYRAPEILLGCTYDTKIDIWSVGCTLYELYSGKILFPGRNNNEMIKLIMQIKGKFPQKILKRGQFTNHYFNEKGLFVSHEIDNASKKEFLKEIDVPQNPTKDLLQTLKASFRSESEDEKNLVSFRDFLEKCLHLDPNKRFSAVEALCHPFIEFNPLMHK